MTVSKTRKIKVMDAKYISPLQMYGPIIHPMTVNESIAYNLVRKLYNVVEVNSDKNEVKLTILNFNNPNRFDTTPKASKPVHSEEKPDIQTSVSINDNTVDNAQDTTPVKLPGNAVLREVVKDTAIVPPVVNDSTPIPIPSSGALSSEPITNTSLSDDEEFIIIDDDSNNVVNTSDVNNNEGIDEEDETEEDSDESSGDSSVVSSTDSTSPSNKKKHNRGKKHR